MAARDLSSPSIPERWRTICLVFAAVAVGWMGWSGEVLTLPLALLFPALWAWAPNRLTAAGASAGYFLAASRGLPEGIATFFGASVWAGILLWLVASLSFVLVHTALWTGRAGWRRAFRYLTAAVLMAVPPFGIVGWAQPITAAGVIFPGWGWPGLVATIAGLAVMVTRFWSLAAVIVLAAWVWSAVAWVDPPAQEHWQGIDTELGASLGSGSALDQHRRLIGSVGMQAAQGANVLVLPESALGVLTPTVERFWADALSGLDVMVIAGEVSIGPGGYDNTMVEINPSGLRVVYRSRMPVPVSMWQPWRAWFGESGGAGATFFADPVVEIAGHRVAPLICYEQLLVWPILQSAWHRPDTVVAIANGWWAAGTSIPAIQRAAVEAWARLFDLPIVTAFNR